MHGWYRDEIDQHLCQFPLNLVYSLLLIDFQSEKNNIPKQFTGHPYSLRCCKHCLLNV